MEKFFLDKLIKFRSNNFDAYLKRLEDLKKKLRNDSGEDEEKVNGEMDLNEMGSKKGSKKDDDEEGKDGKKSNKKKDEKDDMKDKKKMRKKGGSKANKIQQQRNKKKKTMAKFFLYGIYYLH